MKSFLLAIVILSLICVQTKVVSSRKSKKINEKKSVENIITNSKIPNVPLSTAKATDDEIKLANKHAVILAFFQHRIATAVKAKKQQEANLATELLSIKSKSEDYLASDKIKRAELVTASQDQIQSESKIQSLKDQGNSLLTTLISQYPFNHPNERQILQITKEDQIAQQITLKKDHHQNLGSQSNSHQSASPVDKAATVAAIVENPKRQLQRRDLFQAKIKDSKQQSFLSPSHQRNQEEINQRKKELENSNKNRRLARQSRRLRQKQARSSNINDIVKTKILQAIFNLRITKANFAEKSFKFFLQQEQAALYPNNNEYSAQVQQNEYIDANTNYLNYQNQYDALIEQIENIKDIENKNEQKNFMNQISKKYQFELQLPFKQVQAASQQP